MKMNVQEIDYPGKVCKFLDLCPAASKKLGMNYH